MTAHPHAHLMKLYAEDAAETDKPWERWQWRSAGEDRWNPCLGSPIWGRAVEYQRKPRMIRVTHEYSDGKGITLEYPEPRRAPLEYGQEYWLAEAAGGKAVVNLHWHDDSQDHVALGFGLIHLTKEAAEAHRRAMLGEDGDD